MPNMTVIPQLPLWVLDLDDVPPRNDVDEPDVIAPNLPPPRETATLLDDLDHTHTSTTPKRYPDLVLCISLSKHQETLNNLQKHTRR